MSLSEKIWRQAILTTNATIKDAIENLNKVAIKIVLVVNKADELEGTISDGDIRRGLLKGLNVSSPIEKILHRNPFVVTSELSHQLILELMAANQVLQIPIVDKDRKIIGLHIWNEIATKPSLRKNIMVIMAGGKGTRLSPYTKDCPKPLLMVAGKPILEHIIERAKLDGFNHFVLAINYLGQMIEDYFGNGDRLNVEINYLREDFPLGTAGALSLLDPLPDIPLIVSNGDVITDIRYSELLDFHNRNDALATMSVRSHEWQHPFGVVETRGIEIVGFEEKPITRTYINAGVYVLNPEALNFLITNEYCDMPLLFERIKNKEYKTVAYPMHEPWLDVGKPIDLKLANDQAKL